MGLAIFKTCQQPSLSRIATRLSRTSLARDPRTEWRDGRSASSLFLLSDNRFLLDDPFGFRFASFVPPSFRWIASTSTIIVFSARSTTRSSARIQIGGRRVYRSDSMGRCASGGDDLVVHARRRGAGLSVP